MPAPGWVVSRSSARQLFSLAPKLSAVRDRRVRQRLNILAFQAGDKGFHQLGADLLGNLLSLAARQNQVVQILCLLRQRLARTIFSATRDQAFEHALERSARPWTKIWDEPEYLPGFLMPPEEEQQHR